MLVFLPACVSDRQTAERAPAYESRSGVPVLMDLPLIGFLFQHHVIVR